MSSSFQQMSVLLKYASSSETIVWVGINFYFQIFNFLKGSDIQHVGDICIP